MTWGSKAAANPQVRARADVNSQENWACWAEKLQTRKTPLQTAIPTPGPQVIPSQPHRVGFLGGPGGGPASLPLSWGPRACLCRRGHGGGVTPPPCLRLQSSGMGSSAITCPYRLFPVVQSKPLVGRKGKHTLICSPTSREEGTRPLPK